ncbi:MAG: isoprenyl transferase [Planctomycetia bacterium]|nr:isoprenyl transferase [Planctomycetia bacterium]
MATTPALDAGERLTPGRPRAAEGLPRHVAVIMDGNGRWARQRGLPRIEGHRRGVATVRRITEHCARLGVEQLTLYCLSSENWRRPAAELDFLMHLLEQYLIEERALLMREKIRITMIGSRTGLPEATLAALDRTAAMCAGNEGMRLCLAVNYGSRAEIAAAARALAEECVAGRLDPAAITEETLAARLDTALMPDPDLVIRTAGEMRLSNFLLWQSSYAELWVTDTCWPDFTEAHLDEAIRSFAGRVRRFGGLADA